MTETYYGWKNWETWAVARWITNDRRLYEQFLERDSAEELKQWVEYLSTVEYNPLAQDLVSKALAGVDWEAIYQSKE